MCRASIYEARNNLSAYIKTAENGEVVELTRHDKPVAVILSWTDYENEVLKSNSKKTNWLSDWREKNKDLLEEFGDDDWLHRDRRHPPKNYGKCFD
ncbi:MAG: type II toxin-antitoxin system Phd/YefM family antitoxin [Treponema sp.]|nr:type II toxin-antitoxin system Phd/YefM family antitoxin [Candidatus Treponema equifaecale]